MVHGPEQHTTTEFVTRHEFERLESAVRESATNLVRLTAIVESQSHNTQSLIEHIGAVQKELGQLAQRQSGLAVEISNEQKPKGIGSQTITAVATLLFSALSIGGVLVYQYVDGTVRPLQADHTRVDATLAEHMANGHPHSILARIDSLSQRLDDHVQSQAAAAVVARQSQEDRLHVVEGLHREIVSHIQYRLDQLEKATSQGYTQQERDRDQQWLQDVMRLQNVIEGLRSELRLDHSTREMQP